MFALTLPKRLPNLCSAIRETLGQRKIRQSPGLALNAHSGNEWGKIPVLTGPLITHCRAKIILTLLIVENVRSACDDDIGNVITKFTKASRCGSLLGNYRGLDFAIGGYSPSSPPLALT